MKKRSVFLYMLFIGIIIGCTIPSNKDKLNTSNVNYIPLEEITNPPSGKATLFTNEGRVFLEISSLPILNQSQNYEIWLYDKESDTMVSLGTFKVDEDGNAKINAKADKPDIEESEEIIITLEEFPVQENEPSGIVILRGGISVHADTIEVKLSVPSETSLENLFQKDMTKEPIKEERIEAETIVQEEDKKMQTPPENAIVIIAEETELIRLSPQAEDPDNDKLNYIYTSPFNENGEWQTNYGDAGQYDVTITVSDGTDTSSENILVIINKKEEAPVIKKYSPENDELSANENSIIEFSANAEDLNKDTIAYIWKVDSTEKGNSEIFTYKLDFDSAGKHTVTVIATDGTKESSRLWNLEVLNVNRKPILEKIEDITIKETENVRIAPSVMDEDNDEVSVSIGEPVGDDGEWQTNYDSAGIYTITVSASDGTDIVSQDVKITVENVNRPPIIKGITKR